MFASNPIDFYGANSVYFYRPRYNNTPVYMGI